MRAAYSVLREIHKGIALPTAKDYDMQQRQFENFILFLENEGFIERVLRIDSFFSIKPARLTKKGQAFLEKYNYLEETYPDKQNMMKWIRVGKEVYSNEANEEN